MCKELSKYDIDFVRRVSKEIVCCLLPDELPFFGIVWQAIGPILEELNIHSLEHTDYLGLLTERLRGQALAAPWSRDADLLTGPLIMVLRTSLESAIARGVCSDDELGQIIAERSFRWPLPERFLQMVQMFVAMVCGAVAEPSTQVEKFISQAKSRLPHKTCYYVFHDGSYHYYPDELPAEVASLQSSARFWINQSENKFFSCGQEQEGKDYPKGEPQKMLRFLCLKENAGQTVSFRDLYKHAWRSHDLPDDKLIRGSIDEAQNVLNRLARKRFIVLDKTKQYQKVKDDALILRFWGEDKYKISPEAPKECCIISKFELPE